MTVKLLKILIVDDHPIVRVGLAAVVEAFGNMKVAAQAANGEQAIEFHARHQPDVTLMDLRMPGLSGVETIRAIRLTSPEARFVVLTTYEGDEDIHQALQAGARGYLIKGMPPHLLAAAIERVHAGGTYLPPSVKQALVSRTPNADLSAKEREVLSRIAQGKSNKEIASELHLAEITVKCRVSVILERLDAADRTDAVMIALRRGMLHLE
ncbi:MAG: response regulator transcription factor [Bryocella sp.]